MPELEAGLRGLEETRRVDLEEWMDDLGLDAVVFPAVADVGPADMDVNEASADLGWRNGVWVANGNLVPRHLGIPTVTVPMGTMGDIRMPVGLTFAGRAYDDTALLALAAAFEATGSRRTAPPRTPRARAELTRPGRRTSSPDGHSGLRAVGWAWTGRPRSAPAPTPAGEDRPWPPTTVAGRSAIVPAREAASAAHRAAARRQRGIASS